jgi:hypothetical protein
MRRTSTFWGAIFLLAGALLLLENLGVLSIDAWQIPWPVAIILFGIWVLWRAATGPTAAPASTLEIPLDGAETLHLALHHGAGRLRLGGGAAQVMAVAGEFEGGVEHDTRMQGTALDVDLRVPTDNVLDLIPWGSGHGLGWDVRLNEAVRIELTLESGASENRLDLEGLNVSRLTLKTGASDTRIRFSERPESATAEVNLGAAAAELAIPASVSASIRVKSGLTEIKIDESRFPRSGDTYQSPDFASAAHRLSLTIEAGVGSIEIV